MQISAQLTPEQLTQIQQVEMLKRVLRGDQAQQLRMIDAARLQVATRPAYEEPVTGHVLDEKV